MLKITLPTRITRTRMKVRVSTDKVCVTRPMSTTYSGISLRKSIETYIIRYIAIDTNPPYFADTVSNNRSIDSGINSTDTDVAFVPTLSITSWIWGRLAVYDSRVDIVL